jgi:hypothetical protein
MPSANNTLPTNNLVKTAHALTIYTNGCNLPYIGGAATWTCHYAYSNALPTVGNTSLHLSTPSTTFGTGYGLFFTEQDLEQQDDAIPELPANTIWKIIIAVLSLGLVIGIAAFMKRKKK